MKIISVILLFVLAAITTGAQTAQQSSRVVTQISVNSDKAVKNLPFSAQAVSESMQTLADGNRIVRKWSNKMYRNSEGRIRREGSSGPGMAFGTHMFGDRAVTLLDPNGGYHYSLDTFARTARAMAVHPPSIGKLEGQNVFIRRPMTEKIEIEGHAGQAAEGGQRYADTVKRTIVQGIASTLENGVAAAIAGPGQMTKYDTRTESLGTQNIDGVEAEGTRTITTIPADAIGNERPIEIVYEKWYSKDLQIVVASRHTDPRFGEQTYRLTNINRTEPDPSLFELPNGYRLLDPTPATPATPATRFVAPRSAVDRIAPVRAVKAATTGTKP
ncbi:MAG: hypothetical protein LC730_05320 [Acidobacteria bacterium]|nr:hypothetical protein [Acidobacteriota bacterium]MCA1608864.1 hypothetical protein [Acidobacteriota bacterium]